MENHIFQQPRIKENTALISLDYKLRALTALKAEDKRNAVFYQTQSLGASKWQKYSDASRQCKDLATATKKIIKNGTEKPSNASSAEQEGYVDLCKRCDELPEQWTVLQITKELAARATCLKHDELRRETTPIWLTIFRCSDPCEGAPFDPILIPLDAPADLPGSKYPNFFEHITSIPSEVRNAINNNESTATCGENQTARLEALEHLITSATHRVKKWLGPWTNLFLGKFRALADQKLESEIYNQIEMFCMHNRIGRTAQRLISLVARRLDLLEDIDLYQLCCSEQLDLAEGKIEALFTLLFDIKQHKFKGKKEERLECFPVLLIVDELLDSMPWEMIHPTGEFCRFASFRVLSEMYRTHAKRIKGGYLTISAKKCYTIINPDRNLAKMSARLQMFYREWYPDIKTLIDQPPTEPEFSDILNKSDVVIYNGHGSGLQFMNGDTLLRRDINCVTFLFGCDSVRLFPNGLFTEMTGTHMYYNAARCPTVIGALWVLTDLYTDIYSMLLVGNWMPTTNPIYARKNIASLDTMAFKACKWQFIKSSSRTRLLVQKHSNLLRLMGDCRVFYQLPARIRCALVCRGLPVLNEACI